MTQCGLPITKANNGADRGVCNKPLKHKGSCGSERCARCGVLLTASNTHPSRKRNGWRNGSCRQCLINRHEHKRKVKISPIPETEYTFRRCGCTGILPNKNGHNLFAKAGTQGFQCRVARIISCSQISAKTHGYAPILDSTPHYVIRKMMAEPNCELCGALLIWGFGQKDTPHLHHNHETGEPLGFTHPICNPRAMQNEIERLKEIIKRAGLK